ncbi:MAG: exosortase system-associated protein, TIGR04073 family [Kiritimatiellaceae bacterium]|nr:exosortase system-associated protein, TIGR04073 family [Kiritimatiellaceae bacterium]
MRFLTVLLMIVCFSAGISYAEEEVTAEDVVQDMSTKLNRGVVNVLTGWVEIPRQVVKTGHEKSWWKALPVGLPAGVIMTVARTGVGAFETVLFFAPINDSYEPILDPAYVWQ